MELYKHYRVANRGYVLILVLVEVALGDPKQVTDVALVWAVLILVLVEVALGVVNDTFQGFLWSVS